VQLNAAYNAFLDNRALMREFITSLACGQRSGRMSYSDFTKLFVHCTVNSLSNEDISTNNLPESVDWRVKGAGTAPGDDLLTQSRLEFQFS
jgi:hypothetical protein